jgi:hypothetical protein
MEPNKVNSIYDRLLGIKLKLDSGNIPDPKYINQKIGECHAYIEEVEHFSIEVSKEISVLGQALNNSNAEYEYKKEELISKNEDVKTLPSIKDREAKANQFLKEEINRSKDYKNELMMLTHLEKALHVKMRNLDRANKDIKSQQRIMESQMRLMGTAPGGAVDQAAKSLVDEFKKSMTNTDSFEDSSIKVLTEETVDPTSPLDVERLVEGLMDKSISQKTLDPNPDITPSEDSSIPGDQMIECAADLKAMHRIDVLEEDIVEEDPVEEDEIISLDPETANEIEEELKTEETGLTIDLNEVIDFSKKEEGGTIQRAIEPEIIKEVEPTHKDVHQETQIGIDIDDLLDSLQP